MQPSVLRSLPALAFLFLVTACSQVDEPEISAPERTTVAPEFREASNTVLFHFEGRVDRARGIFEITRIERPVGHVNGQYGVAEQAVGWCPLTLEADGSVGTGSVDTFELYTRTGSVFTTAAECAAQTEGGGDNYDDSNYLSNGVLCVDVVLRSFHTTDTFEDVYAYITQHDAGATQFGYSESQGGSGVAEPGEGRESPDGDLGGLFYYGDMGVADGHVGAPLGSPPDERTVQWTFNMGIDDAFEFSGVMVARTTELCNTPGDGNDTIDNDCDGVANNNCGEFEEFTECFDHDDCDTGFCQDQGHASDGLCHTRGKWQVQLDTSGITGYADSDVTAVAIDDDWVALGVGGYDNIETDEGAVFMFKIVGGVPLWTGVSTLTDVPLASGMFGSSVEIDGNRMLVADDSNNCQIFKRTGDVWSHEHTVGSATDCHLSGSRMIYGDPTANTNAGEATILLRSGVSWASEATLTRTGTASGDQCGSVSALSSTRAAVVCAGIDKVTLWERTGTSWAETDELALPATYDELLVQLTEDAMAVSGHDSGDDIIDIWPIDENGDFGARVINQADTFTVLQPIRLNDVSLARLVLGGGASGFATLDSSDWSLDLNIPALDNDWVLLDIDDDTSHVMFAGAGYPPFLWGDSTGWQHEARFDGSGGGALGHGVDIDGTRYAAGLPDDNSSEGEVLINKIDHVSDGNLLASDGASGDRFGRAVGLSGTWAVAGAPLADITGNDNEGAAYFFERTGVSTWTERSLVNASDAALNDNFGEAVAISGDYAVIGASNHDTGGNSNAGAAYIFARSGLTWSEQDIVIAGTLAASDNFGEAVAIDSDPTRGDRVVVGARGDDDPIASGAAYVFKRDGVDWNLEATFDDFFTGLSLDTSDDFGRSVAIDGDYIAVGAPGRDTGPEEGAVYIFRLVDGTWEYDNVATATDVVADDELGRSVGISHTTNILGEDVVRLVAGAGNADRTSYWTDDGQAYVFQRLENGAWSQEAILLPTQGGDSEESFGGGGSQRVEGGVAIDGNFIVAGAPGYHPAGESDDSGAVFTFIR